MSSVIESLERAQLRRVPNFAPGDRVRVHFQVVEGSRRRTQVFEGVVLKRQGHGVRETFTVRKQSFGVGVVRRLLALPSCEALEVAREGEDDLLVPLVRDAVRAVDPDARRVDVDLRFLGAA